MKDVMASRNEILERLVTLRLKHAELIGQQSDRFEAVSISSVLDGTALELERIAFVEEAALADEFISLAEGFPACEEVPSAVVEISCTEGKSRWFGLRRASEPTVAPVVRPYTEETLQQRRLVHLVSCFADNMSERRLSLQHASYMLKRVVVGLNQSAAFSVDEIGRRKIDRDRHGLEVLVSLVDRSALELVLRARRLEAVSSRFVATADYNDNEETASDRLAG